MTKRNLLLLLFIIPLWVFGQNDTLSKKQLRKQRPVYLKIGVGTGYTYFRDFATSPLNYGGNPLNVTLAYQKIDRKIESKFAFNYFIGAYYANVESNYSYSTAHTFNAYYSRLFGIPTLSTNKWNVKAGGMLDATFNLRYNESLGNNGGGEELFATLFASAKAKRDLSRQTLKQKKIWFIKYQLQPRKKDLSFRLNLAVINSTYRNGYAYTGQSYLVNENVAFDNYEFKVFSGYRMSSSLDYTYWLKNKNALQFSYVWDAYQTGGDLDKFEMALHTFTFSILFNTK